jgi:hypothetical protein
LDEVGASRHIYQQSARGQTAIVEQDGACILIVRRPVYPGWVYRINQGLEQPVIKERGNVGGGRNPSQENGFRG